MKTTTKLSHLLYLLLLGALLAPTPAFGQVWHRKRLNLPPGSDTTGKFTPVFSTPSGIDYQTFFTYLPDETGIATYQMSAQQSGGEWGNGVYLYSDDLDDGSSTTGAGTGWKLLNTSGNAQKSANSGVVGTGVTSITCTAGVVTVNVLTGSAQFVSNGTWVGVKGLPAGWANGMHIITGASNPKGTTPWEATRLFKTYTWADSTCPDGATLTGATLAPYTQGTIDELPDQPQRGHREIGPYDYDSHAIWISSGVADNNIGNTVLNNVHSGTIDLYSFTKSGANWNWFQWCGFGGSSVGITDPTLLPAIGPGALCGQQFLTSTTTNQGVNGLWCLDSGLYGTGITQSPVGAGNCSWRMAIAGYDRLNHAVVIFGGSNGNGGNCETLLYYPATNHWKSLSNGVDPLSKCGTTYPGARWNQASSHLPYIGSGQLVLFGGSDVGNSAPFNDTWIFHGCAENNIAGCSWTKITDSTLSPAADLAALNQNYDWVPTISRIVYLDGQAPTHIWYWNPSNHQWTDQGTGGCDPIAGCPTLTYATTTFRFNRIAAYNDHTNHFNVINNCTTTTTPACGSTTHQVWVLDMGGTPPPAPQINFNPTTIAFPSRTITTTSAPVPITLTNSGTATLNITSIVATSNFAISSTTCGSTLTATSTCTINVTFTPALAQAYTGTLTVTDTPNSISGIVALSGTGLPSPTDTTPPAITITSPTTGVYQGTITITGTSSDNIGVDHITIMYGASTITTLTTSLSSWSYTWDTSAFSGTSRTLTATAYDAAGNSAVASKNLTIGVVVSTLQIPITIQEALYPGVTGFTRASDPVTVGLPIPQGKIPCGSSNPAACTGTPTVTLTGATMGQFRCLAIWPTDNSCKWLLVDTQASLLANQTNTAYTLTSGTGNFGGVNLATDATSKIVIDTGVSQFEIRKANFVGITKAVSDGQTLLDDAVVPQGGLVVKAHPYDPNPAVWTACATYADCSVDYSTIYDNSSTCSIEENGPVRASIKCMANMIDSTGHVYLGVTVRFHFYQGRSEVSPVVSSRNANEGTSNTFASATKAFQSFEWRLHPLITSGTYVFGKQDGTIVTGTSTPAYVYQAYTTNLKSADWPTHFPFLAIAGSTLAQNGYEIHQSGLPTQTSLLTTSFAPGWGSCTNSDGSGISIGHYQMGAENPKSLQFANGCGDVTIGMWPAQALSDQGGAIPYYHGWPLYTIHHTWINFKSSSNTGNQGQAFQKWERGLIARARRTDYNTAGVFLYPILDPAVEDTYWTSILAKYSVGTLTPLADLSPTIYRYYDDNSGGNGAQADYRYAWMVDRWLGRGLSGGYLRSKHFYWMLTAQTWSRSDGFNWRTHTPSSDLYVDGSPVSVVSLNNTFAHCRNQWSTSSNDSCTFKSEHKHLWSLIDYYYMSGDEDAHDQIEDGYADQFLNTTSQFNTVNPYPAGCTTNCLPGSSTNNLPNTRGEGVNLQLAAHIWKYFGEQGNTTAQATVATVMDRLASLYYLTPCVVDANGVHYPTGCTIQWNTNNMICQTCGYDRGVSPYRGLVFGNLMDASAPRCTNPVDGKELRCTESMMPTIGMVGLWEATMIRGTSWSYYNTLRDRVYGVMRATDSEAYIDGAIGSSGVAYAWATDTTNNMTWIPGGGTTGADANGSCSAPITYLYYIIGSYNGTLSTDLQTHLEHCMMKKASSGNFNINNTDDFDTWLTAGVLDLIINPPNTQLSDVPLNVLYDSVNSNYTITWTPPTSVNQYILKSSTNPIIDTFPLWSPSTNLPLVNLSTTSNWFIAPYASVQPVPTANSIVLSAPAGTHFFLKALAGGTPPPPPPAATGSIITGGKREGKSVVQ